MSFDLPSLKQELLASKGINLDQIADGLGTGMDPKIQILVATLMLTGYKTIGSCEGHPISERKSRIRPEDIIEETPYSLTIRKKWGKHIIPHHPWVDIEYPEITTLLPLAEACKAYNSVNKIPWHFSPFATGKHGRFAPENDHPLDELQATIAPLSEQIYQSLKQK